MKRFLLSTSMYSRLPSLLIGALTVALVVTHGAHPVSAATFTLDPIPYQVANGGYATTSGLPANSIQFEVSWTDTTATGTHRVEVIWGDGSPATLLNPATSPVTFEHTYPTTGPFLAEVDVINSLGGTRHIDVPVAVLDVPDDAEAKIVGPEFEDFEFFGDSVDLDASTLIVGVPTAFSNRGRAHIYVREPDQTWRLQQTLAPTTSGSSADFGAAVEVSGDFAVVGAPEDDRFLRFAGAAFVFKRDGTTWAEQQVLIPKTLAESDAFGRSVAIHGDILAVGAERRDTNGDGSGSVFIYRLEADAWALKAELTVPSFQDRAKFGRGLALADGWLVVGAPSDQFGSDKVGTVYAYQLTDGVPGPPIVVKPSASGAGARFGTSVDVEGGLLAVGAPNDPVSSDAFGSAYLYELTDSGVTEIAHLGPITGGQFHGWSVDLDGNRLVVGVWEPRPTSGLFTDIEVVSYEPDQDGVWEPVDRFTPTDGDKSEFTRGSPSWHQEYVVADGGLIVSVNPRDDDANPQAGAAYVWNPQPKEPPPAESTIEVAITLEGPSLDGFLAPADTTIVWRNDTDTEQSIVSDTGAFDSGLIPPGGAFVVNFTVPGRYAYGGADGSVAGSVWIGLGALPGDPSAPIESNVPGLPPLFSGEPPTTIHPEFGIEVVPGVLRVGFEDGTTIGVANTVLADAGVLIVGSSERYSHVVVRSAEETVDAAAAAQTVLRASPVVRFAALVFPVREETIPAPAAPGVQSTLQWVWDAGGGPTTAETGFAGAGGNWNLELARFPQAWNLLEAMELRGDRDVRSLVLDAGFEAHVDLDAQLFANCPVNEYLYQLGLTEGCTPRPPSDHGNHVAGIVAATYDNKVNPGDSVTIGVSGGNPRADLIIVPTGAEYLSHLEFLINRIEDGTLGDVRVISMSLGRTSFDSTVWPAWPATVCRQGPNNDTDMSMPAVPCTPNSLDSWLDEIADEAESDGDILEDLAALGVVLVKSSGNSSLTFPNPLNSTGFEPIDTHNYMGLTSAARPENWTSENAIPLILVESIGGNGSNGPGPAGTRLDRANYSNIGGDISAPGANVVSLQTSAAPDNWCSANSATDPQPNQYCVMSGTSQAAPLVSAAIGLLLEWNPDLETKDIRRLLSAWDVGDTTSPAAPRMDVFSMLLALEGAARALVDVNDPSADGNRRVILAADGTTLATDLVLSDRPDGLSAPDGAVDMRDFRRFRDAVLDACLRTSATGCPAAISLDGAADHPKRDLNGDGCPNSSAMPFPCLTSELAFPRFDFNGDNSLDPTAELRVALRPDGEIAATRGQGAEWTDVEVLASQFDEGTVGAEGWTRSDLAALLNSGDLTVHADQLFFDGFTDVSLLAEMPSNPTRTIPVRTSLTEAPLVMTIPGADPVNVTATASVDGRSTRLYLTPVPLAAGEDRRVDLCPLVSLDVAEPTLPIDGTTTVEARALVTGCGGLPMEGISVGFALDRTGDLDPTLSAASAVTAADGVATVTLTAGQLSDRAYLLTATMVPLAGAVLEVETSLHLLAGPAYVLETLAATSLAGWIELEAASINNNGRVAFHGTSTASVFWNGDIHIADGHADAFDPTTTMDLTQGALSTFQIGCYVLPAEFRPYLQFNDQDQVVTTIYHHIAQTDPTSTCPAGAGQYTWITSFDESQPGTPTIHAQEDFSWLSGSGVFPGSARVGAASIDNSGRVAYSRLGDLREQLTRVDGADELQSGWAAWDDSATLDSSPNVIEEVLWPRAADDGYTVARAGVEGFSTGVYEGFIAVTDFPLAAYEQLAPTPAEFVEIGMRPGISDDGVAVVHTGDRGSGPGVYLKYRNPGVWSGTVTIAGENGSVSGSELGTDADGLLLYLADISLDAPVAVQHEQLGAPGIADDIVVVAFLGTPNAAGETFGSGLALWTTTVEFAADGAPIVGTPLAVVQVGEEVNGETILEIELDDPLATGTTLPRAAEPGDHQLGFVVQTAQGARVVRATWLGSSAPSQPALGSVAESSIKAESSITPAMSNATSELLYLDLTGVAGPLEPSEPRQSASQAVTSGPLAPPVGSGALAAWVIDNAAPTAGLPVEITNRTRGLDTSVVPALLTVGDEPVGTTLAGDTMRMVTFGSDGIGVVQLTAEDVAGTPSIASWTVPVTVIEAAPDVDIDTASQTVQYSDPVADVVVTASDVEGGSLSAQSWWDAGTTAGTPGLPDWLRLSADDDCVSDSPDNQQTCTWTLSAIPDPVTAIHAASAPGEYTVRVRITDDDTLFAEVTTTIIVEREDSRSFYTGPLFVSTSSTDTGLVDVEFRATVQDITAATGDPVTDPDAGDIGHATLEFRDAGGALLCSATSMDLVTAGDTSVGTGACFWTANIGNADAAQFDIHIVVSGYYIDTSDTEVVLTVAKPLDGFITGGGYLLPTDSAGVYAAGEGERLNYGFNVKFNKKHTGLQGRVTIIVRGADGSKYKIKSNRLLSLGVDLDPDGDGNANDEPFYAEFQGRANLTDVTDDLNPISLGGNLTLQMRMHDNGEPGDTDTIGFSLWDSSGALLFSSNWSGVQTVEQAVAGGNLQVH